MVIIMQEEIDIETVIIIIIIVISGLLCICIQQIINIIILTQWHIVLWIFF